MICRGCGERFEVSDLIADRDYYPYGESVCEHVTQMLCPECGSDDVAEDVACAQCGEQHADADMQEGLCRFCLAELHGTLDWIKSMLSGAQLQWVAEHPEWVD